MEKRLYFFGLIGFVGLLCLATVFYQERIIFSDAAFYLFNIVKDGQFAIFHSRFIAVLTEIFPLTAVKLGIPLQQVMLVYSVGFVIYYLIAYLVSGLVFKNYGFALVILLINTLFITDTFYWMLSELPQGMVLMCVMFSVLNTPRFGKLTPGSGLICLLFMPVIVYSHPLILFPFFFALIFLFLHQGLFISRSILYFLAGLFVAIYIIKGVFSSDQYDSTAAQGLRNFVTLFPDYFTQYSFRNFLENWLEKYYWMPITIGTVSFVYINKRSWLKLALVLFSFAGFAFLINVSYPSERTDDFYFENLYTPLGFILGLPLVFDVLFTLERRSVSFVILGLILTTCLIRIPVMKTKYVARLDWLKSYMSQHVNEKLIVSRALIPMDTVMMEWGTPYEVWLLSTPVYGKTASIVITENPNSLHWATQSGNHALFTWGFFPYKEFPARYFSFPDTTSLYKIVQ